MKFKWLCLGSLLFIFATFFQFSSALLTDGVLLYWSFDELGGNLTFDDSLSNNTGDFLNNSQIFRRPGVIGNEIVFNSSLISNVASEKQIGISGNTSRSVGFWGNFSLDGSDTSLRTIFTWGSDGGNNDRFMIELEVINSTDFNITLNPDDEAGDECDLATLNYINNDFNQRHYYSIVTNESGGVSFFLNGSLESTANCVIDTSISTQQLHLGADSIFLRPLINGSIDEFIIYNRTITAGEVSDLYNSGEGFNPFILLVNSEKFNATILEGTIQTIEINITYDDVQFPTIIGNLHYNNTVFFGTSSGSGNELIFETTFTTPSVPNDFGILFNWQFELINSTGSSTFVNSTINNQTVLDTLIDDCTSQPILLLNYTIFDETDQSFITPIGSNNISFEINILINNELEFNQTFSDTNPIEICTRDFGNSPVRLDAQARYSTDSRVTEFDNIRNLIITNSSLPINISIFDLLITESQEFLITLRDSNFLPISNSVIDITRKYVGEGIFKTVERPLTDFDGRTVAHFVLNDVVYTIFIRKEGDLIATFDNIVIFCDDVATGDCRLNLNIDEGTTSFEVDNGLNVTFLTSFNQNTRTFQVIYSTTDGTSKNVRVNITRFDAFGNVSLCFNQLTASSGTINCVIPDSVGNVTGLARVLVGNNLLTQQIIFLPDISLTADQSRFLLAVLLIITLPLIAFTAPEMMMIFYLIGLVLASTLGLISVGGFIGPLSAFLWLVVATGVVIWKISRRDS